MEIRCLSLNSRWFLLFVLSFIYCPTCFSQGKEKPNIIFILADDLGYGDVSCFNKDSKIATPHIDKLAAGGVVFTDAHSSSAVCTPTRYGILTGRYDWRSTLKRRVLNGFSPPLILPGRRTIANILKDEQYETACIGKWHLGWDWSNIEKGPDSVRFDRPITNGPTTRGFDYFYGISGSLDMSPYVYVENDMPTSMPDRVTQGTGMGFWREGPTGSDFDQKNTLANIVERGQKYIEEKANTKSPFFLYLALTAPHTPILPAPEFQGKSGLNPYGDFVLMIDDMVGRILTTLDRAGIGKNTIVVFTSDNGCSTAADLNTLREMGHNPSGIYRGNKADLFEGGHRIPCIVRWPAELKPHKVSTTICLNDFMATFAQITGYTLKDNEGEDSYSLLPLLKKNKTGKYLREATISHSVTGEFSIRKGDWKLLLSPSSGGWSYPRPGKDDSIIRTLPPIQLYNLRTDPGETHNVYATHHAIVKELNMLIHKYLDDGRSTKGLPQKNDGVPIILPQIN